jgi:glucose/arabinose dehydrogenase
LLFAALPVASNHAQAPTNPGNATACAGDAGITLPPGFCATVFADHLGHPRQMVVAPDGVLFVNTWSGRYYQNDTRLPAAS